MDGTFVFRINLSATLAAPIWGRHRGLLLKIMQKVYNLIQRHFVEYKYSEQDLCQSFGVPLGLKSRLHAPNRCNPAMHIASRG